ncbi:hypothetical protein MKZ02_23945 [Pseudobacillus sp. FSL P4-0506]|uniref:hypothetical protein n=1 Tax=Pseudobacillus sp. FSL P4-0506 TaxID=2921576 RepID=UPI0030FC9281
MAKKKGNKKAFITRCGTTQKYTPLKNLKVQDVNRCFDKEDNVYSGFHVPQKCFIDTHPFTGSLFLSVGGPEQTLIEDITCNHNKTLLILRSSRTGGSGFNAQPIQVIIRTRGCTEPITTVLPPGIPRVFQVEDFESLVVANLGSGNEALLEYSMEKTFCICCSGEDNNQKCRSCCGTCNDCEDKEKCHTCIHCKKCNCSCDRTN